MWVDILSARIRQFTFMLVIDIVQVLCYFYAHVLVVLGSGALPLDLGFRGVTLLRMVFILKSDSS